METGKPNNKIVNEITEEKVRCSNSYCPYHFNSTCFKDGVVDASKCPNWEDKSYE